MIQIKSKKLFSYLNPFQDLLPGQDWVFNQESIKNFLLGGNIYHDKEEDLIVNNYKKIAYLVSHPEELFVKLNIPTNQENLKTMLVEENDNVLAYVALAYLNQDVINADIEGDKTFAKTFFNVTQKENFTFSTQAVTCQNDFTDMQWVVKEALLVDSWRDKDFVLQNLQIGNIEVNQKLVPLEFWDDADFFKEFMKKHNQHDRTTSEIFDYALKNHKYNPHFLHYVMDNYNSYDIFKNHYFKDYAQYKKGFIIHPNQELLKNLVESNLTRNQWMRQSHNSELIILCFSSDMLEKKETIIDFYKASFNDSFNSYNPLFESSNSSNPKILPFIAKKDNEWRLNLFETLIDTFLEHSNRGRDKYRDNNRYFDDKYNFLLFTSINISKDFTSLIKDMPSNKKDIYMESLQDYCTNNAHVILGEEVSKLIIDDYPQYFDLLEKEHRTLNNLKKLGSNIRISIEELVNFNDKELNLIVIGSKFFNTFIEAFPTSYIKDEDYVLALINQKSFYMSENKILVKFIEQNKILVKAFIDKGHYKKLSPKIFTDIELSEHLIGVNFSSLSHDKYSNRDTEIKNMVNPVVFSNLKSLEKILEISNGHYLKQVPHLFKHKPFVKMVFKLYDAHIIHDVEYLPANVRLILDSYKIRNNFESFFVKYDLQNTLTDKFSENKPTQKIKNKI